MMGISAGFVRKYEKEKMCAFGAEVLASRFCGDDAVLKEGFFTSFCTSKFYVYFVVERMRLSGFVAVFWVI